LIRPTLMIGDTDWRKIPTTTSLKGLAQQRLAFIDEGGFEFRKDMGPDEVEGALKRYLPDVFTHFDTIDDHKPFVICQRNKKEFVILPGNSAAAGEDIHSGSHTIHGAFKDSILAIGEH
jgi:hypothetical protein